MAWPTRYLSNYRPEPGVIGWSTRHLIAEQPNLVIELAERKLQNRINDKFVRFFHSERRGSESGWSSTSTILLDPLCCLMVLSMILDLPTTNRPRLARMVRSVKSRIRLAVQTVGSSNVFKHPICFSVLGMPQLMSPLTVLVLCIEP